MTCIRFSGGTIEANRAFVGVFTLFQVSILPPQCKSNPSARFKSHLERKGELRVKVYSSIEKAFSVHKRTLVQNRCWAFEDLAEVAILISSHRQACLSSMSHASFNNGAFAYYDSIRSFCFLNEHYTASSFCNYAASQLCFAAQLAIYSKCAHEPLRKFVKCYSRL